MAEPKRFDAVTITGILLAIALMIGGQMYLRRQAEEQAAAQKAWREAHPEVIVPIAPGSAGVPPAPAPSAVTASAQVAVTTQTASPAIAPQAATAPEDAEPKEVPDVKIPAQRLTVELSALGATIKNAELPQQWIDPTKKGPKGLEILAVIELFKRTFGISSFDIGPPDPLRQAERLVLDQAAGPRKALDRRVWKLLSNSGSFDAKGNWTVVYAAEAAGKYEITKVFTVNKDISVVRVDIAVANKSEQPVTYRYQLYGSAGIVRDVPEADPASRYVSIVAEIAGRDGSGQSAVAAAPDVIQVSSDAAAVPAEEKRAVSKQENLWGALKNRFYMTSFISLDPRQLVKISAVPIRDNPEMTVPPKNVAIVAHRNFSADVSPQTTAKADAYALYLGPADEARLEDAERALLLPQPVYLELAIQYCDIGGWRWPNVDWLARRMLWVFRMLHSLFGSYGLAVVLLTILIRLCLHPLQRKMMISMNKMQKIQPEIKKIQEKYKGQSGTAAKQKMMQEQQDLMKKAGANPAAGCLPMFIQLPVFTALYGIFNHAFEIRGAEFLWIRDLSRPDHLMDVPIWPNVINLLPIIYMGMTILQTRLTPQPKSDDPQQEMNRKMMMFMPVVFSLMFYSMPAGLVLYFAASAIFGMLEAWYIRKHLIKDGSGSVPPNTGGKPPVPVKA